MNDQNRPHAKGVAKRYTPRSATLRPALRSVEVVRACCAYACTSNSAAGEQGRPA